MSSKWTNLLRTVPLPTVALVVSALMYQSVSINAATVRLPGITNDDLDAVIEALDEIGILLVEDGSAMVAPLHLEKALIIARLSNILLEPYLFDDSLSPTVLRLANRIGGGSSPDVLLDAVDQAMQLEDTLMTQLGNTQPDRGLRVTAALRVALSVDDDKPLAHLIAAEASESWKARGRLDVSALFDLAQEGIRARIHAETAIDMQRVVDLEVELWKRISTSTRSSAASW